MSDRFWYTQVIPDCTSSTGARETEINTAKNVITELSNGRRSLDPRATNLKLLNLAAGEFNTPEAHCLRCYVSHQIKLACKRLTRKHGEMGGFSDKDIFPCALEDFIEVRRDVSSERLAIKILSKFDPDKVPLSIKILFKFDPDKAQLSTYTDRIVFRCREVQRFLKDRGISPWTDWGLLNGATNKSLDNSTLGVGLEEAKRLLTCFHEVYTEDRRKNGKNSKTCPPPTPEQLQEICDRLSQISPQSLSRTPEDLQLQLELIANGLRAHRMGGNGRNRAVSFEQAEFEIERQEGDSSEDWGVLLDRINDRDILLSEIEQVTRIQVDRRYEYYRKRKNGKPSEYLEALHLHFDRGMNQTEIAVKLEWREQSKVSRLLNLKNLYTDVVDSVFNGLQSKNIIPSDFNENHDEFESIKELIRKYLDEYIIVDNRSQTVISHAICKYLQSRGQ